MIRGILSIVITLVLLGACTQRLICPAYQSAFIYDKESLRKKFSYLKEDSTPRILTASTSKSNRYLVAVPESYRKKFRKMQTVEMKPVYPVIPDSLKEEKGAEFSLAESDPSDSLRGEPADSVYAITRTKEKYNLDQDLYMWYFRDILVLPDVRAALEHKNDKKDEASVPVEGEKKKGGIFRNPFRKKQPADSTVTTNPNQPVKQTNGPDVPKKKGGLFKKKADPIEKKEGDGF